MSRLPAIVSLISFAALAQPMPWALDLGSTELVVKVWKTGAAAGLAHDHVVRASKFSGKAALDDAGKPESLALDLLVDVSSLIPDEPEARRRYHLPNTPVSESDRKKIQATMRGDEVLDAAKFPTIAFQVSKVSRQGSGALQCLGKLTLHGVTKELLLPIKVKSAERQLEGDGSVRFKTSDFGIKPYSAALGLIRNKDEVELVVHLVLKR